MKKITTPSKLMLKLETVKALKQADLRHAIGGATSPCVNPTTTVLPSGAC
jgi:hypothetical protein